MKPDLLRENLKKILSQKTKRPFSIIIIIVSCIIIDKIKMIESREMSIVICIILICVVLSKDTIYKCVDRWCKRDENIEKEKTRRVLGHKSDKSIDDLSKIKSKTKPINNTSDGCDSEGDMKIYSIKHRSCL